MFLICRNLTDSILFQGTACSSVQIWELIKCFSNQQLLKRSKFIRDGIKGRQCAETTCTVLGYRPSYTVLNEVLVTSIHLSVILLITLCVLPKSFNNHLIHNLLLVSLPYFSYQPFPLISHIAVMPKSHWYCLWRVTHFILLLNPLRSPPASRLKSPNSLKHSEDLSLIQWNHYTCCIPYHCLIL